MPTLAAILVKVVDVLIVTVIFTVLT